MTCDDERTMLRYFIGIEPPADQRSRIADVMGELGDPWPVPHVTLKSPHGLTPDLNWLPGVRGVAARAPRTRVRIGSANTFGDRVLYLAVEGEGLKPLHRALDEAVRRGQTGGEATSERPFVAHLTLIVARPDEPLPPYHHLTAKLADLDPFDVAALTVFQREEPRSHYHAWAQLLLEG